jgi:hypothetical protein
MKDKQHFPRDKNEIIGVKLLNFKTLFLFSKEYKIHFGVFGQLRGFLNHVILKIISKIKLQFLFGEENRC